MTHSQLLSLCVCGGVLNMQDLCRGNLALLSVPAGWTLEPLLCSLWWRLVSEGRAMHEAGDCCRLSNSGGATG